MATFDFTQAAPSTTWVITHNLGAKSAIIDPIHDDGGTLKKITPVSAVETDDNTITLTFGSAISGFVRLVSSGNAIIVSPVIVWTLDNPDYLSNGTLADTFGNAVAVNSTQIAIGSRYEDRPGAIGTGVVHLYDITTGNKTATITNPSVLPSVDNEFFGWNISMDDNNIIIAAPFSEATAGGGSIYVYDLTSTGSPAQTIHNPSTTNTAGSDDFGNSLALFGDRLIVTAWYEQDSSGVYGGVAYIYNVSTGALVHTLANPDTDIAEYDYFGNSCAITGTYAAVGTVYQEVGANDESGVVYVFNVATGALVHTIENPTGIALEWFGSSVSMTDSYIAVGSSYFDAESGAGRVYVFNTTTAALLQTIENPSPVGSPDGDLFGNAVRINGTTIIVGAHREDEAVDANAGKVYGFDATDGSLLWTVDNPGAFGTNVDDNFGEQLAMTNTHMVVGVPKEDDAGGAGAGKAFLYLLP